MPSTPSLPASPLPNSPFATETTAPRLGIRGTQLASVFRVQGLPGQSTQREPQKSHSLSVALRSALYVAVVHISVCSAPTAFAELPDPAGASLIQHPSERSPLASETEAGLSLSGAPLDVTAEGVKVADSRGTWRLPKSEPVHKPARRLPPQRHGRDHRWRPRSLSPQAGLADAVRPSLAARLMGLAVRRLPPVALVSAIANHDEPLEIPFDIDFEEGNPHGDYEYTLYHFPQGQPYLMARRAGCSGAALWNWSSRCSAEPTTVRQPLTQEGPDGAYLLDGHPVITHRDVLHESGNYRTAFTLAVPPEVLFPELGNSEAKHPHGVPVRDYGHWVEINAPWENGKVEAWASRGNENVFFSEPPNTSGMAKVAAYRLPSGELKLVPPGYVYDGSRNSLRPLDPNWPSDPNWRASAISEVPTTETEAQLESGWMWHEENLPPAKRFHIVYGDDHYTVFEQDPTSGEWKRITGPDVQPPPGLLVVPNRGPTLSPNPTTMGSDGASSSTGASTSGQSTHDEDSASGASPRRTSAETAGAEPASWPLPKGTRKGNGTSTDLARQRWTGEGKQRQRELLGRMLKEELVPLLDMPSAKVLTLAGRTALEVLRVYLPLGFRPENIHIIERDPSIAADIREVLVPLGVPGSNIHLKTVSEFAEESGEFDFSVVSLDYSGVMHPENVHSIHELLAKNSTGPQLVHTAYYAIRDHHADYRSALSKPAADTLEGGPITDTVEGSLHPLAKANAVAATILSAAGITASDDFYSIQYSYRTEAGSRMVGAMVLLNGTETGSHSVDLGGEVKPLLTEKRAIDAIQQGVPLWLLRRDYRVPDGIGGQLQRLENAIRHNIETEDAWRLMSEGTTQQAIHAQFPGVSKATLTKWNAVPPNQRQPWSRVRPILEEFPPTMVLGTDGQYLFESKQDGAWTLKRRDPVTGKHVDITPTNKRDRGRIERLVRGHWSPAGQQRIPHGFVRSGPDNKVRVNHPSQFVWKAGTREITRSGRMEGASYEISRDGHLRMNGVELDPGYDISVVLSEGSPFLTEGQWENAKHGALPFEFPTFAEEHPHLFERMDGGWRLNSFEPIAADKATGVALLRQGWSDEEILAAYPGTNARSLGAWKAHLTRGTYGTPVAEIADRTIDFGRLAAAMPIVSWDQPELAGSFSYWHALKRDYVGMRATEEGREIFSDALLDNSRRVVTAINQRLAQAPPPQQEISVLAHEHWELFLLLNEPTLEDLPQREDIIELLNSVYVYPDLFPDRRGINWRSNVGASARPRRHEERFNPDVIPILVRATRPAQRQAVELLDRDAGVFVDGTVPNDLTEQDRDRIMAIRRFRDQGSSSR